MVLISLALTAVEVELHLFFAHYLLGISSVNCLIILFAHLYNRLSLKIVIYRSLRGFLSRMLNIYLILVTNLTSIFSKSVACHLILFTVSFII